MNDNKKWFGLGISLLAVMVAKQILNSVGGIRSFPYFIQIIIMLFSPILYYLIIKKEKKKMNDQQYKYIKIISIFIYIIYFVVIIIIVLNNSIPDIWTRYRSLLLFTTVGLFIFFTLYIVILAITDFIKIR